MFLQPYENEQFINDGSVRKAEVKCFRRHGCVVFPTSEECYRVISICHMNYNLSFRYPCFSILTDW